MKKIIVVGVNFNDDQKQRLSKIGEVQYIEDTSSSEEFLKQVQGFDVICTNSDFLLENLPKLKNVFVTYPFIEIGSFDSEELKKNGVFVANTQGSNRDSIIEWVIFMTLSLFRQFIPMVRTTQSFPFELKESLFGKKVLIIGKGNIGTKLGTVCETFGMNVDFFTREDNLSEKSANVDLVINCLNCNPSSKNFLNEDFFMSLNKGTYFISFVRYYTYDIDGLIKAIDNEIVAGAAIDCDPEDAFDVTNDFYKKALSNPKILVTPHIAFSTKQASVNGREFALKNIESFIDGNPINILTKI